MFITGRGYRSRFRQTFTRMVKKIMPPGIFYNTPHRYRNFFKWIPLNDKLGDVILLKDGEVRFESLPRIVNHHISHRFRKYARRNTPPAYIVRLKNGIVLGSQTNLVLSSDNTLSSDISREFGAYGGKPIHNVSIYCDRWKMPSLNFISGKVAVISTQGCCNFHHWLYDSIPRVALLKEAGFMDEIDYFLISHNEQCFHKESLQLLKIPEYKILNPLNGVGNIQSDEMYVPSMPSPLGSVSPWVISFLRNLFNPKHEKAAGFDRIFISRKNVKTRHILNHEEFMCCLTPFSVSVVYPEDYSVSQFSRIIAGAQFIISVHGSGLSNLCFMSPGTQVIDILAPYHQDAYYWQITNICEGFYTGFFAEGSHPDDDVDLVKKKLDEDLLVNTSLLSDLLKEKLGR